ncbi:serine/threonine protein kinase, partial [Myxococcota bacterium]|nr:serine/threonine protein kinase [Myxococcota bacterium]
MRQIQLKTALGSGAFGTVYKADLLGGQGVRRSVAVKVLSKSHEGREMFLARIRDEARLLGLLEDDYILKVLELLRVDGRDAVMMELVEGVDLATMVELRLIPPPRALASLGAMLAGALYKAHTATHPTTGQALNVIHRDVKPANVMVTARGGVKLLDFGIAKAAFESRESSTGRMVLGTLQYIAPEYLITGKLSTAVDIYSLALTLLECVTGGRFGNPKLNQTDFEKRRELMLTELPVAYAALQEPLRQMMDWSPERRPTGQQVEQMMMEIADATRGTGLQSWCSQTVPQALNRRPPTADGEGLSGRTLIIEAEEDLGVSRGGDVTTPVLEPTTGVRATPLIKDAAAAPEEGARAAWSP